jgi:hypothetical protein
MAALKWLQFAIILCLFLLQNIRDALDGSWSLRHQTLVTVTTAPVTTASTAESAYQRLAGRMLAQKEVLSTLNIPRHSSQCQFLPNCVVRQRD